MGCVGSRAQEALIRAVDEAIKENSHSRLKVLLSDGFLSAVVINRKNFLHQAAWMGHPKCVQILLEHGANPDECHRKNGCTPIHLAHFCTVEDTNPQLTVKELLDAGGNVNNPGNQKCGKHPIDHAIQHQRLDAVQVLLNSGSMVTLQSVLISIDVANPQILELLLLSGAQCGKMLNNILFWGQPLHRVLYTPLKCPRECYKQMFQLLVQATICFPIPVPRTELASEGASEGAEGASEPAKHHQPSNQHLMIESELKALSKDSVELTVYFYAYLLRNGFFPTESIKNFMNSLNPVEWVDAYLSTPPTLRDLSVRVVRSNTYLSGNVMFGVKQLNLPSRIRNLILLCNPL